ncbi:MAG TPA: hypothetical protein VFS42_06890 [Burkholderiaceae bacterium]|nr:hypothetical protein [Burkholderiaceae bacterium]
MSNPFYNFVAAFVPGTKAKAAEVNAEFNLITAAFDAVNNTFNSVSNTLTTTTAIANNGVASAAAAGTTASQALTTATAALARTGGIMSGAIAMANNKITGLSSATAGGDALSYGQSAWSLAAGTFTGAVAMSSNKITSLGAGAANGDALSYGQSNWSLGSGGMSGNLDMNNNKVVDLAPASANGDALSYGQALWSLGNGTINGNATVTGALTAQGSNTFGVTSAATGHIFRGNNSGTAAGTQIQISNGASVVAALGNTSGVLGGAYSAEFLIYSNNSINLQTSLSGGVAARLSSAGVLDAKTINVTDAIGNSRTSFSFSAGLRIMNTDNSPIFLGTNGVTRLTLDVSGNLSATGAMSATAFNVSSSASIKQDIEDLLPSEALTRVMSWRPRLYRLKSDANKRVRAGLVVEESPESITDGARIDMYGMLTELTGAVQHLAQRLEAVEAGALS